MATSPGQRALRVPFVGSGGTMPGKPAQATGDQAYIALLNPAASGKTVTVTAGFAGAQGQTLGRQPRQSGGGDTANNRRQRGGRRRGRRPVQCRPERDRPNRGGVRPILGGSPNAAKAPGVITYRPRPYRSPTLCSPISAAPWPTVRR